MGEMDQMDAVGEMTARLVARNVFMVRECMSDVLECVSRPRPDWGRAAFLADEAIRSCGHIRRAAMTEVLFGGDPAIVRGGVGDARRG